MRSEPQPTNTATALRAQGTPAPDTQATVPERHPVSGSLASDIEHLRCDGRPVVNDSPVEHREADRLQSLSPAVAGIS